MKLDVRGCPECLRSIRTGLPYCPYCQREIAIIEEDWHEEDGELVRTTRVVHHLDL